MQWFRYKALYNVVSTAKNFQAGVMSGQKSVEEVFNENSLDLSEISFTHCMYYIMNCFNNFVKASQAPQNLKSVLEKVCLFCGLTNILDDKWSEIIPNDQVKLIKRAVQKLMDDLRPEALALIEAFDISDVSLASTIGSKDGNAYERMFKAAIQSPLNK